jgi:hypothetical protein
MRDWAAWEVGLRERGVGKEGLSSLRLALHERDRAPRDLRVDEPPLLDVVHPHVAALLAFRPSMICSGGMTLGE